MLKYWLFRLGLPVVGRLRPLLYPIAAIVGTIAWALMPGLRRRVARNLTPVCGGNRGHIRRASLQVVREVARYYVDLASLPYRQYASFERDFLEVAHLERVAVLDEPGPRIVVGAHTAGTELALRALLARGYEFTGLVEPLPNPALSRLLVRWRGSAGGEFHEADLTGLRRCLAALRAGGLITLMADRDIQGNGVCVMLFGRHVRLPRGPWDLARRTGAPVLPILCARGRGDHIRIVLEAPIRVARTPDAEADLTAACQSWASQLERHLRRYPGRWAVLEDFWKVHRCG